MRGADDEDVDLVHPARGEEEAGGQDGKQADDVEGRVVGEEGFGAGALEGGVAVLEEGLFLCVSGDAGECGREEGDEDGQEQRLGEDGKGDDEGGAEPGRELLGLGELDGVAKGETVEEPDDGARCPAVTVGEGPEGPREAAKEDEGEAEEAVGSRAGTSVSRVAWHIGTPHCRHSTH